MSKLAKAAIVNKYDIPLSKDDLYNEICKSQDEGKLTENAIKILIKLANSISNKCPQYNKDAGLYDMFENWHKYNRHLNTNPIFYFINIFTRHYDVSRGTKFSTFLI